MSLVIWLRTSNIVHCIIRSIVQNEHPEIISGVNGMDIGVVTSSVCVLRASGLHRRVSVWQQSKPQVVAVICFMISGVWSTT